MHSLVRRYIKTAIAFLIAGLLLGLWMIARRELWNRHPTPYEISAHTHVILVGFVITMILGVALWLFPRPEKTDQQYQPRLAGLAYWLLTIGTVVRGVAELMRPMDGPTWLRWTIVIASSLQIAALGVFFYTMWPRIRAVGSAVRESKGERF